MTRRFPRRELLSTIGGMTLAAGHAEAAPPPQPRPRNADEVLTQLKQGNARFVAQQTRHAHESSNWRKHLVGEQHPVAMVLGCSDSRVPPELVFDQGFGDLFIIRVAGNVIAEDVVGSIAYGVRHLKTPLLVVLGHHGCGAVTAALATLAGEAENSKYIQALVRRIEPGLAGLEASLRGDARVNAAVEANVRWSMQQLAGLPEWKRAVQEKLVTLVGGVYDLSSGKVRFLQ